jgi:hypothetical protein
MDESGLEAFILLVLKKCDQFRKPTPISRHNKKPLNESSGAFLL